MRGKWIDERGFRAAAESGIRGKLSEDNLKAIDAGINLTHAGFESET